MAKLINPLMSQDARGSVSGIQFSRNHSGCFGSRKSTSNRKQSVDVLKHRSRLKRAQSAWVSLSASLKSAWEAYVGSRPLARSAFVGAQIRNYTHGSGDLSWSPLPTPSGVPITNMRAYMPVGGPARVSILWNPHGNAEDHYLFYLRIPRGLSVPHVRQFKYQAFADPFDQAKSINIATRVPLMALRVVHWDYFRGVLIEEFRCLLHGSAITQVTPV